MTTRPRLSPEQALVVAMLCDTARGTIVRRELARLTLAWRKGLLLPRAAVPTLDALTRSAARENRT